MRRWWWLWMVLGVWGWCGVAWSQPAPQVRTGHSIAEVVLSADDLPPIEDPHVLLGAGAHALANGDRALAEAAFNAGLDRLEVNLYTDLKDSPFREALLAELLGEWDRARALWRGSFEADTLTAYFFLQQLSRDPQRTTLLEEARAHLTKIVDEAKAGGTPTIYITRTGGVRPLAVMSNEDARAALSRGEKLNYVYVDELDLSEGTFDEAMSCQRCVVGSLKAYGSTFSKRFSFRGVVLKDAHLGKRWKGEVNKSGSIPAATMEEVFLDRSVVLGSLNLDSLRVTGRIGSFPLTVVEGDLDARNVRFAGIAEFRYLYVGGRASFKGAELDGPSYFGYTRMGSLDFSRVVVRHNTLYFNAARFAGPVEVDKCELVRGATFEGSTFDGPAVFRQSRIQGRLNFSRSVFHQELTLAQVEVDELDMLGTRVEGRSWFNDSVFGGSARFALDGLTRRLHLSDVRPLHPLYKLYQGDDDAEDDLTTGSQYGVLHVDDLTAQLLGEVSFANSIFQKFVNFEGVQFGDPNAPSIASFYNTQFYGEAHFERTKFYALADFRTIFGNELAFNRATFYTSWLLDDANVPGRLSASGARLEGDATLSFYGARINSLGVGFEQLTDADGEHRLFYERCALDSDASTTYAGDPRLWDASWDSDREVAITDPAQIQARVEQLCMERTVSEFVVLRDSFSKRGMIEENDWSYWYMRHYRNLQARELGATFGAQLYGWTEWLIFEKGFGWGVRLSNLMGTTLVVVLVFMLLIRIFCGEMMVDWDGRPTPYRELPLWAMFVVSFHSFLGRTRDWKASSSPRSWKLLYTLNLMLGIILITFFIGAYTRMVLR